MRSRRKRGRSYTIGIDEVGRGALAGPVVVAALALSARHGFRGVKDSKKLTPLGRERWFNAIKARDDCYTALSRVSPRVIDRIGIVRAANRAADRAYRRLREAYPGLRVRRVVLDGGLALSPEIPAKSYIRGDERFPAVALASVAAKVTRDRYMTKLHIRHPQYGFNRHKGYGARQHARALRRSGPSAEHRLTFIGNFCKF